MPKLIVQHRQQTLQELELTEDRVVIGRGDENAVKLDDNLVSREHAEITTEGGHYLLSDMGSANGTYVGGKKITRGHELKDGDVIKISPYTILFRMATHEKPTQMAIAETVEKPTEVFTFSGTPRLLARTGAEVGKSYDLSNNPFIGRDPECDIVLNEATVSRRHARIQFLENKLTIVDVGSRSGTRVNGKLIDRPTQLKDGDKVQLGEATLEVDWKGAPKVEAEKATVPFFRPELAPARKEAPWWKWVVGIAAGIIVVVGLYLVLRPTGSSPRRVDPTRLIEDARVHLERAVAKSDLSEARTALARIDSAMHIGQPGEREKDLKEMVVKLVDDFEDATRLAGEAEEAMRAGRYDQAVRNADMAAEKAPKNVAIREVKKAAYKARARDFERLGDRNKAYEDWKAVISIAHNDPDIPDWVFERLKKRDSSPGPRGQVPVPPEEPKLRQARGAYYDERLDEAEELVDAILREKPGDLKAVELKTWIDLWQLANYYRERGDTEQAENTLRELLRRDPNNSKIRRLLDSRSGWDGQRARDLFGKANSAYSKWKDYGLTEFKEEARKLYDEIVKMGPPPADASQQDKEIYGTSERRLAELSK